MTNNSLSLLAKNGYLGLGVNEQYGGSGENLYDLGILFERLGYHAAPLSMIGCLVDVVQTIQKFSDSTILISRLIGAIVGGEIHTSAILEPLNQDPENPLTRAEIDGDNLIITGTKYLSELASKSKSILVSVNSIEGVLLVLVDSSKVKISELSTTANSPVL